MFYPISGHGHAAYVAGGVDDVAFGPKAAVLPGYKTTDTGVVHPVRQSRCLMSG
jgi:hypothetical protein